MRMHWLALAITLVSGCGGKVAVDGAPAAGGAPGAGGALSTSFTCDFLCGGPVGLCACSGKCSDGKTRAIACGDSGASGITCACAVDDVTIGNCGSPTLSCQLQGSCCEIIFAP